MRLHRLGQLRGSTTGRAAVILLAVWVGVLWAGGASAAPDDQKSILILLPGQAGLPAATAIAGGIRAALLSAWSISVSIETEHVDIARFPDSKQEHLREVYRAKYAGHPLDLIIVAANEPLQFLLRWRDQLWPGTPVIACAVDERTLTGFTAPAGMASITIRYDFEGTLRAALALLPDTRHVALAGGVSPQDRGTHELARQAVRAFGNRVDLIDLTNLSVEELTARVSRLPERTVLLGSSLQVDAAGRRFYGADLVSPISIAANRPLFSVFGTVMGRGIVGGSLVDFEAVGREAGTLALRSLRGEAMPVSPVRSEASSLPMFDERELRRWGLDERRLPERSQVLHREPTLWGRYGWLIALAFVLLVAQTSLIVGLLVERKRRRDAQDGLGERLRFEALLESISATFSRLPAPLVDQHIRDCLRLAAIFLGADRATLWQLSADRKTLSSTHAWAVQGAEPSPATVGVSDFPILWPLAERGRSLATLARLPEAASAERQFLARLGVKSIATIPLRIGDQRLGLLAFVALHEPRSWPAELVERLQTLGDLFANALVRRQAGTALESSEALTTAVLTALPAETGIVDADGNIVQVNEAWAVFARAGGAGSLAAMSPGANYLDACRRAIAMPEESARTALPLIDGVLRGHRPDAVFEYHGIRPDGNHWFELRVQRLLRPGGGAALMHFDITARKEAEAESHRHLGEVAHMDRVAAMGELAASLAHELNQPLTAILSNAQAARRLLAAATPDLEEVRACLEDITSDDRRAGEVIRRMRSLLKKQTVEFLPIDLNALAEDVVIFVSNDALVHQVAIQVVPSPAKPGVYGDSIQIQQVLLNLLVNAITAAAAGPGRDHMVTVWTGEAEGFAELGVRDSGKGIAESDLGQIFDPFFTTKTEGLGMGLAISRSIVEAHGGRIWAQNDPAGGAVFMVRLPTDPKYSR